MTSVHHKSTWRAGSPPWRTRFLRAEEGAVAVEFAFVGAILAMLLICGADIGLAFYSNMQVQASAEAGAQYASAHGWNVSAINAAVTAATPASGISAAPSEFCGCPNGTSVTSATCGSTCGDGNLAGIYVQVKASRTYSTLFHYPIVPRTISQTATSTVRIE
jgi:Flp pilus assembly protein TadG